MIRHGLPFVLVSLCACFRGFEAVEQSQQAELPTLELEVSDQRASIWDADQAPRTPVLTLRAKGSLGRDAERHLFLLRGTPNDDTVEDLRSGALREATMQQLLALEIQSPQADAEEIAARPRAALTAGADYTLLWADARGSKPFALRVSASPAAGAQLVQSLPAALDARVPPNLARALLRFDGYIEGDLNAALRLRDAAGQSVAHQARLVSCEQLGLSPGDCVEIKPQAPLVELARYVLAIGPGLRDATGVDVPELEIAFRTGASGDTSAPEWLMTSCAKDEAALAQGVCVFADEVEVSLRARANENGVLSLACGDRSQSSLGVSGDYAITLALGQPRSCVLALVDQAGNQTSHAVELAPARDLATVTIAEVRADPLGAEPAQEFVELLNFGDQATSLRGFTLTTDVFATGAAIVGDITLAPGERGLAVAPDFDAGDTSDGALSPGVRLVRLERALSLRNDGAALFLRDASGRRLSAAPALAARPGQCIVRSSSSRSPSALGERARQGTALDFRPDPSGGCTPGFASDGP